jgi:MFS family permease
VSAQSAPAAAEVSTTEPRRWLNRNVWALAVTSFLSDLGHETATAALPSFLAALGAPPVTLGAIEGIADAASSSVKLVTGWISDRVGRRKPFVVAGYIITGISTGLYALANTWVAILGARTVGWISRGARGPLRDVILTQSVPAEARGRAFGFHRAGDTVGAVLGPLFAAAALPWLAARFHSHPTDPFRWVFVLSVIPGVLSGLVVWAFVTEQRGIKPNVPRFLATIRGLPREFRRYLVGVGVFGAGDFAHTLLIMGAAQVLAPGFGAVKAAALASLLFVVHNIVYAVTPFPVGWMSDRVGRRGLLSLGYAVGAVMAIAAGFVFARHIADIRALAGVFALAGFVAGVEDTLEGAATADYAPVETRGTAFGVLGLVNGAGDLVSSLVVGALWLADPMLGFGYAAVMMAAGAFLVSRVR